MVLSQVEFQTTWPLFWKKSSWPCEVREWPSHGLRSTSKEIWKICPGKRERSDASSRSTRSLTGRLLASLSLGSASNRRSPPTSGRCWACRRLAMVAVKDARWQGTGRGYIVSCALRRLKHALVPVVGSNAIRIFKRCCPQTPDARWHELLEDADEGVATQAQWPEAAS